MPDKGKQMGEGRLTLGAVLGLPSALKAAKAAREETARLHDQPNAMSYGDELVEAISQFVDAKLALHEVRRGRAPNNYEDERVTLAGNRLAALIDDRRRP